MLNDKIDILISKARKERDTVRLMTLRYIKDAFLKYRTQKGTPILDELAEITIMKKMVSQRKEAIDQFVQGNSPERAAVEQAEIDIITEFLPAEVTPEEIDAKVHEYMDANQFTSIPKNCMGICIKFVKGYYPAADGKIISDIVKGYLG